MSLQTKLSDFATRIGTEFKTVRALTGALVNLTTTAKTDLVSAINEVNAKTANAGAQIDDAAPATTTVYSSSKTENLVATAVANLAASAPAALDTLDELAAALGDDPNFAASTAAALGNRVRVDAAQALTAPQQAQARANIAAGTSNLVIGTTAADAKAGNWTPAIAEIQGSTTVGRAVLGAVDAPAARTAIGAGTSSLVIGTTAGTAKEGNYAPPVATATAVGTVELATDAEAQTGTDTGRAITPANLSSRTATETRTGIIELATVAEAATGTDVVRAVTPAGLKGVADTKVNTTAIGDPEQDLVALFNAALV